MRLPGLANQQFLDLAHEARPMHRGVCKPPDMPTWSPLRAASMRRAVAHGFARVLQEVRRPRNFASCASNAWRETDVNNPLAMLSVRVSRSSDVVGATRKTQIYSVVAKAQIQGPVLREFRSVMSTASSPLACLSPSRSLKFQETDWITDSTIGTSSVFCIGNAS